MKRSVHAVKNVGSIAAMCILALAVALFAPTTAFATSASSLAGGRAAVGAISTEGVGVTTQSADSDILLGMFTNSLSDWTNTFYGSYDGETMYRIGTVYESEPYKTYDGFHYGHQCPSLMYHDGYFWALSSWNRNDGKFWPAISYSKDLEHWTHLESDTLLYGTHGVEVDSYPTKNGKPFKKFDVVAPEWSKAADGSIYIVFSAGYFGEFHGKPFKDQMQAYTVRVDKLYAFEGLADGDSGYLFPNGLAFETEETAHKLSFTNYKGADFIDGQLYTEGGVDYLVIKKNSQINQLYKTKDISNPKAWKLVNSYMTYGYEGGCLVKFKGKYRLYTDGVYGTRPMGIHLSTSKSLTTKKAWEDPKDMMFLAEDNTTLPTRHGTVIVLKAGSEPWQIVKDKLDAQKRVTGGMMYRLYNGNTGEHFYTASGTEAGATQRAGWTYEGIAWYAPEKSSKPVYRLYNKYAGDHHYTRSKSEYNKLAKKGWKKEGVGWYSANSKGVPLYRGYNPFAKTGTHHYTTDADEMATMVKAGWKAEGIGWYGLDLK